MRFVLYNIRYATGGETIRFPWSGYFRRTRQTLEQIVAFLKEVQPDIAGLVEVDAGSYRSDRKNQAQVIADELGHYHTYKSKYHHRALIAQRLPIMNKQGNAFITRDSITNAEYHYFEKGVKKLVIELELEHLTIFLVHLALSSRIRHDQLSDLYALVKDTEKPHIVAGDFNSMWGDKEIRLFLAATGLINADPNSQPTFPSWSPKRQLDFILHSPEIRTNRFWVPRVLHSDHLPLIYDFELPDKISATDEP
jgi:endonuclease/exonuclease/phosphatase family metal-dependent hydrolase